MGRRNPYSSITLNKNNDFYKNGQLKEGYSYEGGPDMVAKGTGNYNIRSGAGKDGLSYSVGQRTIYAKAPTATPAAAAPAPPPKPVAKPVPKPTGVSDKLQVAYDFKKSGSNFGNSTQAERKELTDSFKQTPAYDPKAGISSPAAGNFLNDYKLNLQSKVDKFRAEAM